MLKGTITFIIFCFIALTMIDGVINAQGGMLATNLTSAVSASASTFNVSSTSGFASASIGNPQTLFVDQEEVTHTGQGTTSFTGIIRGTNGSSAVSHSINATVFNQDTQMVNEASGFNVVQSNSSSGTLSIVWNVLGYFIHAIPNMLTWDYSFLAGPAIYFRYLLMAISGGVMLSLVISFSSAIWGILKP